MGASASPSATSSRWGAARRNRPRWQLLGPLVVWTLLVWLSRIRNVVNNDELSAGGQAVRIGVAVLFSILAIALAVILRRSRGRSLTRVETGLIVGFGVWTVGYWVVRGTGILIADYSIGFKVIHTVLAVVSLAMVWLGSQALGPAPQRSSLTMSSR